MPSFRERITRKKIVDFGSSELRRALTFFDLTLLGIGSTIGVGFYVLVGEVAIYTGPAVVVSFLIAGIASLFAGLCYAEFGARVPKAGSAYIYSYVCVGECVAFIIGWNLVLEYIIGASSVARGFSSYIDVLGNKVMSDWLTENLPIDVGFLSDYPDFLSFGLIIFISGLLAIGIKESSTVNNVFSSLNLVIVIYVIIAAAINADVSNWQLTKNDTVTLCNNTEGETDWGEGGFAPHGFAGIMNGAATCFFGFVGFDCIATTGEEAINPARNIPLSISVSLLVIFLAYFGMSATVTLSVPYCALDPDAALVAYFNDKDMQVSKWIVSIGALFGFSASMVGVLLPLPRIIYAMANDGIIFRFLSRVNKRFKTPILATFLTGLLAGLLAMLFDLQALVDMMSIGTLMAYTIVAVSVMLLRFTPDTEDEEPQSLMETAKKKLSLSPQSYSRNQVMRQLFNLDKHSEPTELSSSVASYGTLVYCILIAILCGLLVILREPLSQGDAGAIVGIVIMAVLNVINILILAMQPESKKVLSFKVPLVPWMPAVSAFINFYLMFNLSTDTWIRFAIWMAIGFPIYFFYGMFHSTEELRAKGRLFGIDNPGDPGRLRPFVIPTINVQLATPISTAPNTPKVNRIEKKPPKPISPLVLEEAVKNIPDAEEKENEVQKALESLDNVVNDSLPPNELDDDEIEKMELENVTSSAPEGVVSVAHTSEETKQHDLPDSVGGIDSQAELQLQNSVSPADGEKSEDTASAESENDEEQKNDNAERDKSVQARINSMPKSLAIVMSQLLQSVPKATAIDSDHENENPLAGSEKVDRKKPEPLVLSKSAPLSRSTSPVQNSESSPTTPSALTTRSSVPNTPVSRRHPTKLLKRGSSFDEIPPSSADSPLARRVDKFFIIPVKEPDQSDSDSSPLPSPSPSNRSGGQDALMNELRSRIKNLQDSEDAREDEDSTDSKIVHAGSQDSLEKLGSSSDRPVSPVREYKRLGSKEMSFLGEGLDTIRERGESSISVEDTLPVSRAGTEKDQKMAVRKADDKTPTTKPVLRKIDSMKEDSISSGKTTEESKQTKTEDAQSSGRPQSSQPSNVNKLKALFGS
ncbi:high affinity cationic amino acid transporter 1-like [Macrobrachium rosenbergii]|uniref:high affinity cationic amino acid transporter 1-like n=1 Tax=Macrobrachium rosenbergii TaxID=79674 RepID=UPI0034D593A7